MRYLALGALLVFSSYYVQGQILKINKGSFVSDSSGYFIGVADATFAMNNRASTQKEQNLYVGINTNLDIVHIGKKGATMFIGGLNYFKIGESAAIYNGSIHLRHIVKRAVRLTPEFYSQSQFDESRNMNLRYLTGAGYRWNFLQGKNILYAGLGVFYEYEKWKGEQSIIEKNLWKLNSYLSADVKLTQRIKLNAIGYFQSGFDPTIDAFRNRFSGQIEIRDALTKHFGVKLSGQFLLDDRPIIPLNQFTYQTFFGVEYRFN
ncbi:MAG: DUF481 domain-containing protein [Cyclobacteriaceae bacterium]